MDWNEPEDRRPNRARERWVMALVVLLVGLGLHSAYSVISEPLALPAEEQERDLRVMVGLAVEEIEAYREETGSMPVSLEDLGMDSEDLNLVVGDQAYQVVGSVDGVSVVYRSDVDDVRDFFQLRSSVNDVDDPTEDER